MDLQQFAQVGEDLIDANGGPVGRAFAQETQVPLGDFDAIIDLPGDAREAVLDQREVAALERGGAGDMLVDDFDEAGNDGERAVDVMNDARVNLSLGPNNLLLD